MKNTGWIKLNKKIKNHWLWDKPEYLRAWIDMLMEANFADVTKLYNMELVTIKRGEFPTSLRSLSDRWSWSIGKVRRFLKLLENDSMIDTSTDTGFTLIKIRNYEAFQTSKSTPTDTHIDTPTDTPTDTTIRSKEIKNIYNDHFNEFWKLYPRKIGKSVCSKKYKIALKKVKHEELITSLKDHVTGWKNTDLEYIPHPSTWLNQERWNDVVEQPEVKAKFKTYRKTKTGLYIAYCAKCGTKAYPNDYQIKSDSCCGTDWLVDKPEIDNTSKIDKQIIDRIMA